MDDDISPLEANGPLREGQEKQKCSQIMFEENNGRAPNGFKRNEDNNEIRFAPSAGKSVVKWNRLYMERKEKNIKRKSITRREREKTRKGEKLCLSHVVETRGNRKSSRARGR